jgi:hypothetical protein
MPFCAVEKLSRFGYGSDMSLPHSTALLALSALLATASLACGDDDAGGDGGDGTVADASAGEPDASRGEPDANRGGEDAAPTIDSGVEPDGGGKPDAGREDAGSPPDAGGGDDAGTPDAGTLDAGTPDAGPLDAGGPPDAGVDPFDGEFLLSIRLNLAPDAPPVRLITTVDFTGSSEGGSADFTLQPISASICLGGATGGFPVGDAATANGIPVGTDGRFQIALTNVAVPADANSILCTALTGNINVAGAVVTPDLTCGTITVSALGQQLPGTFGAIRIPPGTVGDPNLPAPVTSCPAPPSAGSRR